MKCSLIGYNAKIVAKAIHSLAKFAADLFIEADNNGLHLRGLNATQSAVGSFKFNRTFFDSYDLNAAGDENYCKISMKPCLTFFRNMNKVERCEMQFFESKLLVKLKCPLETVRTVLLSIVEEENITADISADNTPNIIVGSHKLFTEISNNFNTTEVEITLEARNEALTVKNYVEGSRVNDKFMRSQLKLSSAEFDDYKVASEANVTFCLKEFRAFLMFAEALNENLSLCFAEAGNPIFVKFKKMNYVECLLIMSTLNPDDVTFHEDCRESEVAVLDNSVMPAAEVVPAKRKKPNEKTKAAAAPATDVTAATAAVPARNIANESTISTNTSLFQFHSSALSSIEVPRANATTVRNGQDSEKQLLPMSNTSCLSNAHMQSEVHIEFLDTEETIPTDLPHQPAEDADHVPGSPQPQITSKLRTIFSRCFEATYVQKEPSPNSECYVPNSDPED